MDLREEEYKKRYGNERYEKLQADVPIGTKLENSLLFKHYTTNLYLVLLSFGIIGFVIGLIVGMASML